MTETPITHNIVILGASYAALPLARSILTKVLPGLSASQTNNRTYKVIIVGPSDRLYMNVASTRVVAVPNLIDHPNLLVPFVKTFEPYLSQGKFEFIQAYGEAVDFAAKMLTLIPVKDGHLDKKASLEKNVINYESLIIATGATTSDPALQALASGTASDMKAEILRLSQAISSAESICIGGGGITAVELAADIKEAYPNKHVSMYIGDRGQITPNMPKAQREEIKQILTNKFQIEVNSGRVVSVSSKSSDSASKTTKIQVRLPDGSEVLEESDLYIPAIGSTPNTGFLPQSVLDENGYVLCDEQLHVPGAPDVYVTGDVCMLSDGDIGSIKTFTLILQEVLSKELGTDVSSRSSLVYKLKAPPKQKELKSVAVSLGSQGGVGLLGGYRIPNWLVWLLKSRDASLGKAKKALG